MTLQSIQQLLLAGRQFAANKQFSNALSCFLRATELAPNDFDGWFMTGIVYMRDSRYTDALPYLRQAHHLQPEQMDAARALADAEFHVGTPEAALPLWQAVVIARPSDIDAQLKLGETRNRLGSPEDEIAGYRAAISQLPASPDLHMALAQALEDIGDRNGAIAAYQDALSLKPGWPTALAGILDLQRNRADSSLIAQATALQANPTLPDRDRALLGYALGKIHDQDGNADAAMASWHDANAARQRMCGRYQADSEKTRVERTMAVFDASFFMRTDYPTGSQDGRPVFVVGMPRSGTTLTEQILASHPHIHGCGELPTIAHLAAAQGPQWPDMALQLSASWLQQEAERYLQIATRRADAGMRRLIDKAPLNYHHLGLIARLFPNARVIWCQRDPRDIALSIYSENFSFSSVFAADLAAIAHTISLHERLMQHWQAVLPLPIHTLAYEALVADPEVETRKLLDFLDIPWDNACLAFHQREATVQTPSRWQVREPIHSRSTGRWKRYAEHFNQFS